MKTMETIIGTCDNRIPGPDVEADMVTCPRCGLIQPATVRNDADCTCWRYRIQCDCGNDEFVTD